jgi:hypothetical protein
MTDLQPTTQPQAAIVPNKGKEMWDMATALSRSTIIPKAFQGQAANCFVALDMAQRMGASPMEIMQNIYVVHGTPGFSAKYAIGMANKSGVFKGPICFEESGSGASLSVTAFAIVRETGQRVEFTADMAMAKAEKWDSNPKYKSGLASLMLKYRSATLLIRTTCPEVLLGMQTAEEVQDVHFARTIEATPAVDSINKQLLESAPAPSEDGAVERDKTPSEIESPPTLDLDGMFEE